MKSTTIIAILFSNLVFAGPIKQGIVTVTNIETVTVYVKAATAHPTLVTTQKPTKAFASTTAAALVKSPWHAAWGQWGQWGQWAKTSGNVVTSMSTSSVASAVASTPLSTSTSTTASAAASSSSGVDNGSYDGLSDYAAPILRQHNVHRLNHTVPLLQWDDDLAALAKQIADTCVYAHSNKAGDGQYGQNIGAGAPPGDIPKMITNDMYNGEIVHYPAYGVEPDMTNFEVWGHFSQIVWRDTQKIGCYTTKCSSLANVGGNVAPYFTVCNYKPAGNYGGQYAKNVLKPLGEASVVV